MAQKRSLDLDKVLAKASELIQNRGLQAATMPALAQALGVRSQSLYHYVSGRKQLLSLVGARQIKVLHAELNKELIGQSGQRALLSFADIIRNYLLRDAALASILYHLNEYGADAAITQEIGRLFKLGERLNLKKYKAISFHALIGAVLGYVFLDRSTIFAKESAEEASENYHQMILRLVQPAASKQLS